MDAAPPALRLHIGGHHRARKPLLFALSISSLSGTRSVSVDYGDRQASSQATSTHTYAAAGHYTVSVVVTDRAGVSATLHERVTIA